MRVTEVREKVLESNEPPRYTTWVEIVLPELCEATKAVEVTL